MNPLRTLALPVAAALITGSAVGLMWPNSTAPATPSPTITATVQCQEDDPCWDCALQGNHICGGTELTDADRAKAWETWDRTGAASLPTAQSTEETKVTFIGVAPKLAPVIDRRYEVALVGTDAKWYVFSSKPVLSE